MTIFPRWLTVGSIHFNEQPSAGRLRQIPSSCLVLTLKSVSNNKSRPLIDFNTLNPSAAKLCAFNVNINQEVGRGVNLWWEAALAWILVDFYLCFTFKSFLLFYHLQQGDGLCNQCRFSLVSRDLRLILGPDRAIAHALRVISINAAMHYLLYERHNGKIFV